MKCLVHSATSLPGSLNQTHSSWSTISKLLNKVVQVKIFQQIDFHRHANKVYKSVLIHGGSQSRFDQLQLRKRPFGTARSDWKC